MEGEITTKEVPECAEVEKLRVYSVRLPPELMDRLVRLSETSGQKPTVLFRNALQYALPGMEKHYGAMRAEFGASTHANEPSPSTEPKQQTGSFAAVQGAKAAAESATQIATAKYQRKRHAE